MTESESAPGFWRPREASPMISMIRGVERYDWHPGETAWLQVGLMTMGDAAPGVVAVMRRLAKGAIMRGVERALTGAWREAARLHAVRLIKGDSTPEVLAVMRSLADGAMRGGNPILIGALPRAGSPSAAKVPFRSNFSDQKVAHLQFDDDACSSPPHRPFSLQNRSMNPCDASPRVRRTVAVWRPDIYA